MHKVSKTFYSYTQSCESLHANYIWEFSAAAKCNNNSKNGDMLNYTQKKLKLTVYNNIVFCFYFIFSVAVQMILNILV